MNNKWKRGRVNLKLSGLPSAFLAHSGIKPLPLVLDNNIGQEIILLINGPRDHVVEFEGIGTIDFMLKMGIIETSFGPICFLLFYFPNPPSGTQITYEYAVNPKDQQHLSTFYQLSSQRYWHVFIADNSGEVINFLEFPSDMYGLDEKLEGVVNFCKDMKVTDFM